MTTSPSGREAYAGLLERLKATRSVFKRQHQWDDGKCETELLNPDGPEAHAAIIKLEQENAKLRGALKPFADELKAWKAIGKWKVGTKIALAFSGDHGFDPTYKGRLSIRHLIHAAEALRADGEG